MFTYKPKEYWNDLVGQKMKLSEVGWPNWTEAYNSFRYKLSLEQVSKILNNKLKNKTDNINILEIGCGIGFWTEYLSRRFPSSNYTGIDISKSSIDKLKQIYLNKKNINFLLQDLTQLGTFPYKFDLIICFEVLLHITDDTLWGKSIESISRNLSASGLLLISDPVSINSALSINIGMHNKIREIEKWNNELKKNNLEIKKIYPRTFFLDNNFDFKNAYTYRKWCFFFQYYNKILSIRNEKLGYILGIIAYLFDKVYTRIAKYGHSGKLLIISH